MSAENTSDLFARRATRRASIREMEANWGMVFGAPARSPNLYPVDCSSYRSGEDVETPPWHKVDTGTAGQTTSSMGYPASHWPQCPVEGHTTCFQGTVYYYASTYPGRQQRELLEQGGVGADFFDYGNPPPAIWAALYRVLRNVIEQNDLNIIYSYRFNHCPRRRAEIVGEQEEEEEALRQGMANLGIENADGNMSNIDAVMSDWGFADELRS